VNGDSDCLRQAARDAEVLRHLVGGTARQDGERRSGAGEPGCDFGESAVATARRDRAIAEEHGLAGEDNGVAGVLCGDQVERCVEFGERAAEPGDAAAPASRGRRTD
jgi:hypothetical protein